MPFRVKAPTRESLKQNARETKIHSYLFLEKLTSSPQVLFDLGDATVISRFRYYLPWKKI